MITEEQKLYLKSLRGAVLRLPASYFDEINPGDEAVSRMFRTAYAQSQAELIYTWFLEEKIVLPEKLKGQLQLSYDHALHRELLMNTERARIFDFMDEQGIWHCPLKGIQIQPLYPSVAPDMRRIMIFWWIRSTARRSADTWKNEDTRHLLHLENMIVT